MMDRSIFFSAQSRRGIVEHQEKDQFFVSFESRGLVKQ
jgi:hypothetical protein